MLLNTSTLSSHLQATAALKSIACREVHRFDYVSPEILTDPLLEMYHTNCLHLVQVSMGEEVR